MNKTLIIAVSLVMLTFLGIRTASSQTEIKAFNKNRLSLGVLDMSMGEIGLKYERLIGKGNAGLFIPLNINYYQGTWYDYDNKFYTGIGLNYYPTGQGTWKYYCGVEMNIGYGTFYHYDNYWDPWWGWTNYDKSYDGMYSRFLINNGIQYSPTHEFSVDVHLGLGFRNAFIDGLTKDEKINPNGSFGLNLSYWF